MSLGEAHKIIEGQRELLKNAAEKGSFSDLNRVTLVHSQWYPEIISGLIASAEEELSNLGLEVVVEKREVAGALEIPLIVQDSLRKKSQVVLALGCVINGATPHFQFVCQSALQSLAEIQLREGKPVGMGILTVNSLEEAQERKNKGSEACLAALISWLHLEGKFV